MISDISTPPYREVNEFFNDQTLRARKAVADFKIRAEKLPILDVEPYRLVAAVQAALDWDKSDHYIGPPVTALVVEPSTGIRWIQGEERCGSIVSSAK